MRHRNHGRKLGVKSGHRKAMLRQLVEALFLHGRIRTTITRAKEIRPIAERVITWAKKGTLHHRRQAFRVINRRDVVNRVFDQMAEWYRNRQGGYTRIIRLGERPGDSAPMVFLEMVDWVVGVEKLLGQNLKQEKKVEGEEGLDKDKKEKKEKEKKEKEKDKKVKAAKPEEKKAKVAKDPEKEKKKAERRSAEEKRKQERAAQREKAKKEVAAKKEDGKKAEGKKVESKKTASKKDKPKK